MCRRFADKISGRAHPHQCARAAGAGVKNTRFRRETMKSLSGVRVFGVTGRRGA
jgi:hypothetical protein